MNYLENLFWLWVAYMLVMSTITSIVTLVTSYDSQLYKPKYFKPSIKQIGKFQEFHYPKYAYSLGTKSDHCKQIPYSSDYNNVIYTCPNCGNNHHINYDHGDAYKCSCGLKTQSFGNGIYFWT